jgi:mono/diheme cytochrome c family protein
MSFLRQALVLTLASGLALGGCEPKEPSTAPEPSEAATDESGDESEPAEAEAVGSKVDTALGGQLFDKWFKVKGYTGGFLPDSKKTDELDGEAGPNQNGTLNDEAGAAMANAGHDYRLKNFFGWDLRGAEGIYGADYQNKSYVLSVNLLTDTRDQTALVEWFTKGGEGLPAFGDVLSAQQITAMAAFVVATREGELPQPEQIFALSKDAPKNYVLNEGGDAAKGAKMYADSCAGCHGDKGDGFLIDDKYTVGAYGRTKAYEGWYKVVNGHPGSPMSRQSTDAQEVLDLFAALCDRTSFPGKDAENDAPDGDLRCGAYLK